MDGASIRVDNLLSEVDEVVLLNDSVIEVKTQLKTAILDRLDQVVSLVFDGTPVNPSHLFWDTLIEACDCPLLKRAVGDSQSVSRSDTLPTWPATGGLA